MYCKECGQQIADDSKFCNFCGVKQEKIKEEKQEKEESFWKPIILSILFLFIGISAIAVSGIIAYQAINEGNDIDDIKNAITSDRDAKNNDIDIDFVQVPCYTKADEYIVKIQANEKIKSLIIEIDYLDKNRNILKTEIIEIGDVTPGNVYTYTINQNGMNPDNIDKTKSFKYRVTKGYVIKE